MSNDNDLTREQKIELIAMLHANKYSFEAVLEKIYIYNSTVAALILKLSELTGTVLEHHKFQECYNLKEEINCLGEILKKDKSDKFDSNKFFDLAKLFFEKLENTNNVNINFNKQSDKILVLLYIFNSYDLNDVDRAMVKDLIKRLMNNTIDDNSFIQKINESNISIIYKSTYLDRNQNKDRFDNFKTCLGLLANSDKVDFENLNNSYIFIDVLNKILYGESLEFKVFKHKKELSDDVSIQSRNSGYKRLSGLMNILGSINKIKFHWFTSLEKVNRKKSKKDNVNGGKKTIFGVSILSSVNDRYIYEKLIRYSFNHPKFTLTNFNEFNNIYSENKSFLNEMYFSLKKMQESQDVRKKGSANKKSLKKYAYGFLKKSELLKEFYGVDIDVKQKILALKDRAENSSDNTIKQFFNSNTIPFLIELYSLKKLYDVLHSQSKSGQKEYKSEYKKYKNIIFSALDINVRKRSHDLNKYIPSLDELKKFLDKDQNHANENKKFLNLKKIITNTNKRVEIKGLFSQLNILLYKHVMKDKFKSDDLLNLFDYLINNRLQQKDSNLKIVLDKVILFLIDVSNLSDGDALKNINIIILYINNIKGKFPDKKSSTLLETILVRCSILSAHLAKSISNRIEEEQINELVNEDFHPSDVKSFEEMSDIELITKYRDEISLRYDLLKQYQVEVIEQELKQELKELENEQKNLIKTYLTELDSNDFENRLMEISKLYPERCELLPENSYNPIQFIMMLDRFGFSSDEIFEMTNGHLNVLWNKIFASLTNATNATNATNTTDDLDFFAKYFAHLLQFSSENNQVITLFSNVMNNSDLDKNTKLRILNVIESEIEHIDNFEDIPKFINRARIALELLEDESISSSNPSTDSSTSINDEEENDGNCSALGSFSSSSDSSFGSFESELSSNNSFADLNSDSSTDLDDDIESVPEQSDSTIIDEVRVQSASEFKNRMDIYLEAAGKEFNQNKYRENQGLKSNGQESDLSTSGKREEPKSTVTFRTPEDSPAIPTKYPVAVITKYHEWLTIGIDTKDENNRTKSIEDYILSDSFLSDFEPSEFKIKVKFYEKFNVKLEKGGFDDSEIKNIDKYKKSKYFYEDFPLMKLRAEVNENNNVAPSSPERPKK